MMTAYLGLKLTLFQQYIDEEKYDAAAVLCDEVVSDCKIALAIRTQNEETENNLRYVTAITFKGFAEFIQLYKLTKVPKWEKQPKKVESIWQLLCDSSEHLNFSAGAMEALPLENILKRLAKFSEYFKLKFGKGLYASPVIIIDKEICSICDEDVRSCAHRQGMLYNGALCRHVAEKISSFETVDLVEVPKDPRCRLWPWNKKKTGAYEVRILNLDTMDAFLFAK